MWSAIARALQAAVCSESLGMPVALLATLNHLATRFVRTVTNHSSGTSRVDLDHAAELTGIQSPALDSSY